MSIVNHVLSIFDFKVENGKLVAATKHVGGFKAQLRQTVTQVERANRSINDFAGAVKGYLAYLGTRNLFKFFVSDFAQLGDIAAKQSQQWGVTTDQYQELNYALQAGGANTETFHSAIQGLSRILADAGRGNVEAVKKIKLLGLEYKDSTGKLRPTYDVMLDLADIFRKIPEGADKVAKAQYLMGESGAKLLPFLNGGAQGIRNLGAEARRLGIVLDAKTLAATERYQDEMLRLKSATQGLRNAIAVNLIPKINDLVSRFTRWIQTNNNLHKTVQRLKIAATGLASVLGILSTIKVVGAFTAIGGKILSLVSSFSSLGSAALGAQAKMFLWVAVLAAIGLVIEDLYRLMRGEGSAIAHWIGDPGKVAALRSVLKTTFAVLKDLWEQTKLAFLELRGAFGPLKSAFLDLAKLMYTSILPTLGKVFVVALLTCINLAIITIKAIRGIIEAVKVLADVFYKVGRVILKVVLSPLYALYFAIQAVVGGFSSAYQAASNFFGGLLGQGASALKAITGFFQKIGGAAKSAWDIVTSGGKIALPSAQIGQAISAAGEASKRLSGGNLTPVISSRGVNVQNSQTNSVGQLTIQLQGSTDMSSTQVSQAVSSGLTDFFRSIYADIKPLGAEGK